MASGGRWYGHSYRTMRRIFFACLCACALVPTSAQALEFSGGVSVGGMLIGPDPRLAVSPHAAVSWQFGSASLSVDDHLNLLPAVNRLGVGVYNQTSASIGYAWKAGKLSIGPSLAIYSMPACSAALALCGRVLGVGPGGHAQIDVYFAGPLGVSVSANLDWIGGVSLLLPGSVAVMAVAGPILRWSPH